MIKLVCFCLLIIGSIQLALTTTSAIPSTKEPIVTTAAPAKLPAPITRAAKKLSPSKSIPKPDASKTDITEHRPQPKFRPDATLKGTCKKKDLKYVYTPCDDQNNRWRVQVPKSNADCQITHPEAPIKGIKCSSSCKPGEFLDISRQSQPCRKCPAGQYSVGDGERFSSWDSIPEGFLTRGFDSNKSPSTHRLASSDDNDKCKDAKWTPKGHYLESNGSSCRSVLIYDVELDRPGNITFTVKSGDESSLFHVWIDNDLSCVQNKEYDTDASDNLNKYFQVSTDWRTYKMPLAKGRNTVYFLAANFDSNSYSYMKGTSSFDSDSGRTTLINEIVVRGFSSSYDCDKCPEGTYSPPGSSYCISCPENTFSRGGAPMCIECSLEKYSMVRATTCTDRAPCSESDYYMVWEPCKDGKTRKMFKWKEPRICSTTRDVKLPDPSAKLPCPSCNPGQTNNGSECVFCPKEHYSNGNEPCTRCPPQTRDAPGLFYKFWTRYPGEPMHLYCIARPASGCSTAKGWMVHEEYIDTGSGHSDDAELLLVITVPKFTKERNEFQLDFKVECPLQACRFKIELMESDSSLHTIRTYEGHQQRTTFTHVRHSSTAVRYRLVFEKKYLADKQTYKYADSRLKIYYLKVSNALMGGSEKCAQCASMKGEGCITCKPGYYIGKSACIPCPKNTYLENQDNAVGIISCKKCPDGTVSNLGSIYCHSNCQIAGTGNRNYNLSALSGLHVYNGQKRFTTKGYMYYHQFKVTLCGEKLSESVCVNNATNMMGKFAKAAICRSTIIPDQNVVVSAQSISIGKVLQRIELVSVKAEKDNTSSITRSQTDEIRFIFHSDRITEVCKNGTYGIIRMVCDPYQEGRGKVELGDGKFCQSETCDGCNYTSTVKTRYACPTCVLSDIMIINTACVDGVKKTHYVWKQPHVCVDNGVRPADTETECSLFEKSILDFKVIILVFLLGGILLAVVVLYLCYRNRRLSYNYHRLIDASQSKDGEMPASEMCALEDGEEEEEEIMVSRGKGGVKIIDRLRGMRKKKKDFSEFETINLDSIHYVDDDDEI